MSIDGFQQGDIVDESNTSTEDLRGALKTPHNYHLIQLNQLY